MRRSETVVNKQMRILILTPFVQFGDPAFEPANAGLFCHQFLDQIGQHASTVEQFDSLGVQFHPFVIGQHVSASLV